MKRTPYALRKMKGREGANVIDCDGTACGKEVCGNRGECKVEGESHSLGHAPYKGDGFECHCNPPYTGK